MQKLLRAGWWKILSLVLLAYVIIGGLLTPSGPAIDEVKPLTAAAQSPEQYYIKTYNAHLDESTKLWFRAGDQSACAYSVQVISPNEANFQLNLVDFTSTVFDVIVQTKTDGNFYLASGLVLPKTDLPFAGTNQTCNQPISVEHGHTFVFPYREILHESIRNLFFHVPMWFAMVFLMLASFVFSILYLSTQDSKYDLYAVSFAKTGILFGILGLLTGMMWANYTWGSPWPKDPKLNGAAIAMLIYFAYMLLRGSMPDEIRRARVSAVYNLFAFVLYLIFIFVFPRLQSTLHPGQGGNPAFSTYDLDNNLRLFFYPAVIGWTFLSYWIASLQIRISQIEELNQMKNEK